MAYPSFLTKNTRVVTGAELTMGWGSTPAVDNVGILFVTTTHEFITVTTAGWAEVTGSPQGVGDIDTGSWLRVFWKRATEDTAGETITVDNANADTAVAVLTQFKNVKRAGDPYDASTGDTTGSLQTSVVVPALTTQGPERHVVIAISNATTGNGANTSDYVNANLTSLTERHDGDAFFPKKLAVASGLKATAGDVGTTTATLAASSLQARFILSLVGETTGSLSSGTLAGSTLSSVATSEYQIDSAITLADASLSSVATSKYQIDSAITLADTTLASTVEVSERGILLPDSVRSGFDQGAFRIKGFNTPTTPNAGSLGRWTR